MSVITAKGSQAKESANKEVVDTSKIYLRLKDGESHKVRLLSAEDYVEYNAVGDFNNGIFNQPVAEDSPLLKAHKEGGEKFEGLFPRKRYVFVFGSIETGELVAFDSSKTQAKNLISTIEEYKEDIDDMYFVFKRTGEGTSTTYSLNPKMKMSAKDKEAFDKFADTEVEIDFYEKILQPNDSTFLVKLLMEIDPAVKELFPEINVEETSGLEVTDNDLPF